MFRRFSVVFAMGIALAGGNASACSVSNSSGSDSSLEIWIEIEHLEKSPRLSIVISSTEKVGAVQFDLVFPANDVLQKIEPTELLSSGLMESNLIQPGRIRLAVVSSEAILGTGALAKLTFDYLSVSNPESEIRLENVKGWHLESLEEIHIEVGGTTLIDSETALSPNKKIDALLQTDEKKLGGETLPGSFESMDRGEIRKMIIEIMQTTEPITRPVQIVLPGWISFVGGAGSMLALVLMIQLCCSKNLLWRKK
ncbi:MAG: hypothetical protein KF851_06145 [Pirellulaceae bacterium]|nr:hypothetical protein [Pirellulaceae bacterium]